MGLLDYLMPGETGGTPDPTTQGGGLLNNPLLQIGLGILANNQGHYGAFGPAVGMGMQQGMQNIRQSQQDAQNAQLYKMKIDEYKKQQAQQAAKDAALKTWGMPNATSEGTTSTINVPAPQGTDAPNFNTVPQTTTTQGTPYFDQSKALQGMVQSGALDFKDYLTLMQKDNKHTWQDTNDGLIQLDSNGNPTGVKLPKGVSPDTQYTHGTLSAGEAMSYLRPKADAVLSSNTSIRNNNATQAGENARAADKKKNDPTDTSSLFTPQPTSTAPVMGVVTVTAGGKTYTFPNKKAADNFRLTAGVK